MAEGAQILVAPSAQPHVLAALPGVELRGVSNDGAGAALELIPSRAMDAAASAAGAPPPADDMRYLHPNVVPFAQRHDAADPAPIDAAINARFRYRGCCACMFRIAQGADDDAVADALRRVRRCFTAPEARVILCEEVGVVPQRDLFFFEAPAGSLAAVLEARDVVDPATVTGWGLHMGDVLLIPGTDVHWGDAVNTASKVGQDLASPGEIAVTEQVHAAVAAEFPHCSFERKVARKSGIDFVTYSVSKGTPTGNHPPRVAWG